MDKKKENLPEKGAAVQRDMDTYAIIPYIAWWPFRSGHIT